MIETSTGVVIVGAGPTGLMLACELARKGVALRIVEAAREPQPGSRGKGIQPRTLEAFDDLGIAEAVIAHGRFAMPIRSHASDGTVTERSADAFRDRPDIPFPASLIIPEWRVEEALRDRLAELGGAVEFGTAVVDVEQSDDLVTTTVTRDGVEETITARWLVGCDGGHSIVRKRSGFAFEGETREDVRMIVADVPVEGLDREAWHTWRHEKGIVVLCPLPSTELFQFQASIAPGQDPALDLANLQAILDERTGQSAIRLGEPEWRTLWRANIRLVDRYRNGRILLAGDAAHIHSPAGGQGMNTGIQDAHNLGWKLAAVEAGADAGLLDTYGAERRPIAEGVLALSNERLRQTIEKGAIPIRGNADTMQLTVGYRGSSLASDDRDGRADRAKTSATILRSGDRAPDATGLLLDGAEHRLFELIRGGEFTLLRFDAPVGSAAPAVAPAWALRILDIRTEATSANDIVDTAGLLARAYDAIEGTLVLLRPDGFVGLISDAGDAAAVGAFLRALGPDA